MDRGFLIHAYNNEEVDYGTMAMCSARLVKKNLINNNVALVTDSGTIDWLKKAHGTAVVDSAFDHVKVVRRDHSAPERTFFDTRYSIKTLPYRNGNRSSSYDLSPFDETILMDADYLVLDDSLDQVWGSIEHVMINKNVMDLRHESSPSGFDARFNQMSIPLYWATLMYFKKDPRSKSLFELISFIKENYGYYQGLYQFPPSPYFRNDYALSIAIHMLSGNLENDSIKSFPCDRIMVATEFDDMVRFKNGIAYFVSEGRTSGDFRLHRVTTNVHVMNKWSINRMSKEIFDYAR